MKLILILVILVVASCAKKESNPNSNLDSNSIIVFVTSTDHSGNLGGLNGADSICNSRAMTAGLSGTFKAYVSDSSTNAIDRITSNGPWNWRDGGVVIQSKAAISNAEVISPYDENG